MQQKMERRTFFKYLGLSVASLSVLKLFPKNGWASVVRDAAIKMQDYISDSKLMDTANPMNNTQKPSGGKAKWETHKKDPKLAGKLPSCSSCKFYKDPKDGYGLCAMVQATGKAPDKFVNENGWCKLWSHK